MGLERFPGSEEIEELKGKESTTMNWALRSNTTRASWEGYRLAPLLFVRVRGVSSLSNSTSQVNKNNLKNQMPQSQGFIIWGFSCTSPHQNHEHNDSSENWCSLVKCGVSPQENLTYIRLQQSKECKKWLFYLLLFFFTYIHGWFSICIRCLYKKFFDVSHRRSVWSIKQY